MITYEEVFEFGLKQVIRASSAEAEVAKLQIRVKELEIHLNAANEALQKYVALESREKKGN